MADVRTTPADAQRGLHVQVKQDGPIPLRVSLYCAPGRTLAIIGPSGAGKTTVLRSIAGLYRPASAHITCHGDRWADTGRRLWRAPHERRTGLVFQSYALFPHLSARANVEVALGHRPPAERRQAADALLVRVGLAGAGDRRPAALSGGEQQRVALARALARDPAVLLLDEPFSAVDRRTRRQLHADLAVLRREVAVPTVLVTHDLDDATTLAHDLLVLDGGNVLQAGPVQEVLRAPASEVVRAILDLSEGTP
jgi:molybdate transport system ATP-binding protein